MQRSQISQLIQMRSIGISDTTSVDSPCHPEEMAHCRPSSARPRLLLGSTRFFDRCERFSHLILGTGNAIPKGQRLAAARGLVPQLPTGLVQRILRGIPYRTLRANVECARSELRWHRLQPRRSYYRFLRIRETLRPSRFHRRAVEFVVL